MSFSRYQTKDCHSAYSPQEMANQALQQLEEMPVKSLLSSSLDSGIALEDDISVCLLRAYS